MFRFLRTPAHRQSSSRARRGVLPASLYSLGHFSQIFQRSARSDRFQDKLRASNSLNTVGSHNIPPLPFATLFLRGRS